MAPLRFFLSALVILLQTTVTLAQTNTTTSANASATILPGAGYYAYAGCYNETANVANSGGARALAGGTQEASDKMTPILCFSYCGGSQYVGLEYSRECWCAEYLNSLSALLPNSSCDMPCGGDNSTVCGGSLTLTLYNKTSAHGKSGAAGTRTSVGAVVGAVVGGMVVMAFL